MFLEAGQSNVRNVEIMLIQKSSSEQKFNMDKSKIDS